MSSDDASSGADIDDESGGHYAPRVDGSSAGDVTGKAGNKRKRPLAAELAPQKLAEFTAAERQKGLVYLGRIPPGMKPIKVRHLLERHGDIGRIYLAPEDASTFRKRIKSGGNKKLRFTEGWVEFMDKSVGRAVAEMLNNAPITEGKRGFYGADMWNIKFLPHFKWHHLTEKLTYERRVRRDKLRSELTEAKAEAEEYVGQAEAAKKFRRMEERRQSEAAAADSTGTTVAVPAGLDEQRSRVRRMFSQRPSLPDATLNALAGGLGKGARKAEE